jgi:hypothetical protein
MAGIARSIELQRADVQAVMEYKRRLIEYLERFIGDLVVRSSLIAQHLTELAASSEALLSAAATRETRVAAPDTEVDDRDVRPKTTPSARQEQWPSDQRAEHTSMRGRAFLCHKTALGGDERVRRQATRGAQNLHRSRSC